ncbi:hypothetical protein, partial [Escherichia coli]|uniref:hypothetical protein n=1 Tax=Escherichia coli TaxID=562 RepID=UPI0032DB533F
CINTASCTSLRRCSTVNTVVDTISQPNNCICYQKINGNQNVSSRGRIKKNDGSMLFWYSQSISPAREIQTSSSGPKKPAG